MTQSKDGSGRDKNAQREWGRMVWGGAQKKGSKVKRMKTIYPA